VVTDEDLLKRSLEGDARAFGTLMERHESAVCAVSFAVTGDREVSEDVAQDAFVTAWTSLATLRDPSRFRAWACGIARNLANKARALRGRIAPIHEPADSAPNAEELLDAREREAAVWSSLERISPTYREPLVLFYREGRSTKEVAEALGLSVASVEQRLSRGRKQLRAEVVEMVEQTLEDQHPRGRISAAVVAAIEVGQVPVGAGASAPPPPPAAKASIVKTALIATAALASVGLGTYALSSTATDTTPRASEHAPRDTRDAAASSLQQSSEHPSQPTVSADRGTETKRAETVPGPSRFEITKLREGLVALNTTGGKSNLTSPAFVPHEPQPIVGHIEGRVVDADGRPIPNAVVLGGRALSVLFSDSITAQAGVYSDSDGRYSLPVYQADELLLIAAHHEHGMSALAQTSTRGPDAELQIEPFAWLTGTVKEGDEPVPARVMLRHSKAPRARFSGQTEEDGTYRIGPVPPGDYIVDANTLMDDPGNATLFQEATASVVAGRSSTHDVIGLDGAMIVLESTLPEDLDIKWVQLAVFRGKYDPEAIVMDRDNPLPGRDASAGWLLRGGVDSHDGDASFQGLEAGTYTACISVTPSDGDESVDCSVVELGEKAMEVVELFPVGSNDGP